jgi:seryl-tRNA(Sec) selenium transferase
VPTSSSACAATPLARALRVDKLTLAALEATLRGPRTPTWQALTADADRLRERCEAVAAQVGGTVVPERRRGRRRRAPRGRRCPAGPVALPAAYAPRACAPATRASSAGSSATGACSTCGASPRQDDERWSRQCGRACTS